MDSDSIEFVVRCCMGDWGFMQSVTSQYTLSLFCDEIRKRHNIVADKTFVLSYSTPGCKECYLNSEEDWSMMYYAVRNYKLDLVEIRVILSNCIVSTLTSIEVDDCLDEGNQYLGAPYQSNESEKFLCDEWSTYICGKGHKFFGGVSEFRDKFKKYAIQTGFYFFFERNDSRYVHVVCEDVECPFYVKGAMNNSDSSFYIKDCDLEHRCSVVRVRKKNKLIDSEIVSNCMQTDVMYNVTIAPNDLIKKFKLYYGFDISYKIALNARGKALENIYGRDDASFNKLIWYRDSVLESNPGSIFDIEIDPKSNRFVRLFIAYGGCVQGFQNCLPVLYLDGCFGKSSYKGQVIAATSKNGNEGACIYPIALCICDSENEENWLFFLKHLKKITDQHSRRVSFISDRGIGLLLAFDKIFPENPHIFCYHHLKNNLRWRFKGNGSNLQAEKVENPFFKCAYASLEKEYFVKLTKLRLLGGATVIDDFLKDLPVQNWCRAFGVGTRYGIMANTIAESFNNWINLERAMPVYTMLDEVRLKQMEMISNRRFESVKWGSLLTPVMEAKLIKHTNKCRRFRVISSSEGVFEVEDVFSYSVDVNIKSCSCKKWEINDFPCSHAIATITSVPALDIYDFIDPVFTVTTFKKCYDNPINPISNVDYEFYYNDSADLLPPIVKRQPGRRRKTRFKSPYEVVGHRKQIICGRCNKKGNHNRTSCKESLTG